MGERGGEERWGREVGRRERGRERWGGERGGKERERERGGERGRVVIVTSPSLFDECKALAQHNLQFFSTHVKEKEACVNFALSCTHHSPLLNQFSYVSNCRVVFVCAIYMAVVMFCR